MEGFEKGFRKPLLWATFLCLRVLKMLHGVMNCGLEKLPWPKKNFFLSCLGRVWRDLKKDLGSPYFGQPFCA